MFEAGAALAASCATDGQPIPPVRSSPFAATSRGEPGSRPAGHVPPTVLQHVMLQHCLDEEEASLDGGPEVPVTNAPDDSRLAASAPRADNRQARTVLAGAQHGPDLSAGPAAAAASVQVERGGAAAGAPWQGQRGGRAADGRPLAQPPARDARPVNADLPGAAGRGQPARPAVREPAYKFSPPPTVAQMRANTDPFESNFMEVIVRTWPQAPVTALSKKAHALGLTCSGAKPDAHKGTNVEMKTWALRIAVAMRFANFIGRTVCIPARGSRPPDAELDRGVKKFFACLNSSTQEVINCFLNARREALAVAGGGSKVMERTMKGYSAAVGFLFTDARVNGIQGQKVVNDCEGARSPWQKKGQMEKNAEKQHVRDDPGDYIGNPMETETTRTTRAPRKRRREERVSTARPAQTSRLSCCLRCTTLWLRRTVLLVSCSHLVLALNQVHHPRPSKPAQDHLLPLRHPPQLSLSMQWREVQRTQTCLSDRLTTLRTSSTRSCSRLSLGH